MSQADGLPAPSAEPDPEDHSALLVVRIFARLGGGVAARLTTVDDIVAGQQTTLTTSDTDDIRRRMNDWLARTVDRLRGKQNMDLLRVAVSAQLA
jgi:hypothetical protein